MRLKITIWICKVCRSILKRFGRGSSMPGKIALFLYPNILSKIKLPKNIIAVTGSNGKTSTVEMINEVLTKSGYSVAFNVEGSNQIDGVATLVLANCTKDGKFTKDVLLLETDERYAQYTFEHFVPTYYVVTNLYRDQMTRNGNPDFVLGEIKKSINPKSTLILNCDDPSIQSLATEENDAYYFGIDSNKYVKNENDFTYDDGYYCPKCKSKLTYSYHQFGHVGKYKCTKCKFSRKKPDYCITDINLKEGALVINNKYDLDLAFTSIYNAYNLLATFAVTNLIGVKPNVITTALADYLVRNGRVKMFRLGLRRGTLLISKHENSVSYNQNIEYIVNKKEDCTVFLMVDAISRKYFTSETSWLWDINFEKLADKKVKKIIVTGLYSADIAERLQYANIDSNKVYINSNIKEAVNYARNESKDYMYVLTCFSDEKKFTSKVDATW